MAKRNVSAAVRNQLFDDEEVVVVARPSRLATLPKYVFTLGLYGFWRRRDISVLTNQRILMGNGILRRSERSIPLTRIEDVTFLRRWMSSYADLAVHDRGRVAVKRVGPMAPSTARRFGREILRRL